MAKIQEIVGVAVLLLLIVGTMNGQLAGNPSGFSNILAQAETTITMGTIDVVEASIDPAQSYDYFGWMIISALSSGLVEIAPGSDAGSSNIQGALAESWAMSGGGTIWDFNLKQGLTFFDGYPFNASVVKYSFDRNIGLALPDGPQLNMGYANIIDNVTITSEYSVRFYLHIAFAPFLQLMSCPASAIVHPSYAPLGDYVPFTSSDARASHPCGLGPFILTEWVRVGGSDISMRLEKNPFYWSTTLPQTDVIIFRFYASDTALASALSSGEVDVAYRHLTQAQTESFRSNPDFTVWEGLNPQIQYLCFQQDIYPFDEVDIRQGIAAALNKSHVCETVFLGNADPLETIVPAGMAYHKPSFEIYGPGANYSHTVAMLALHGYNTTHKLEFDLYYESSGRYPQSAEQAAVYKSDLEASGVMTVTLVPLEWPSYRQQRNAGTMPAYVYGWYSDYIDADDYAFLPFASWLNMGFNETYPAAGVEEYNLWVDGRSATTDALRQAAYYELQDLQAEQCSIIPLWQGHSVAVSTADVHDIMFDITAYWYFGLLTIDLPPPTTATTTTIPTTTTPTTTTTTVSPTPLDPMLLGVSVGGIVSVIILGVIVVVRRRRKLAKPPKVDETGEPAVIAEEARLDEEIIDKPIVMEEVGVHALRGAEFVGNRLRFKVKVVNNTPNVITDVTVTLSSYPRDSLILEGEISKIVPKIDPEGFRSPSFEFLPTQDCVKGNVIASVSYVDHQGKAHSMTTEPYIIRAVCDLLNPESITPADYKLRISSFERGETSLRVDEWTPEQMQAKTLRVLKDANFSEVESVISEIGEYTEAKISGWAKGKYTGKNIGVDITITGKPGQPGATCKVRMSGEDEAMIIPAIDEISQKLSAWLCPVCGGGLPVDSVDKLKDGKSVACPFCGTTIDR